MSKTSCYTIVVCCVVKISHSEQNAFPNASASFFQGLMRYRIFPSFLLSLSHALLRGPLSWGWALSIHVLLRGPLRCRYGLAIHALLRGR